MSDLKRTKTTTLSDKRVGMYSTVLKTFKSNYFILPLIFILGLIMLSRFKSKYYRDMHREEVRAQMDVHLENLVEKGTESYYESQNRSILK